jgi:hypothetical protein
VPDPIYPAIPEPTQSVESLFTTVQRLKEAVEILTGQRSGSNSVLSLTKTLRKQVGFMSAKFTQQIKVQADDLSSLASTVTTVEARANQATANGEVYLQATAAPGGASAAFGVFLTAGSKYTGMLFGVDSATDEAFINLAAEKFRFDNSGTNEPVFEWNSISNKFEFFVDVEVHDVDIGLNAITNSAATAGVVPTGGALSFTLSNIRAGARIEVETAVTDTSLSLFPAAGGATLSTHTFSMSIDSGGSSGDMISLDTIAAVVQGFVAPYWTFYKAITPVTGLFLITGLTPGSHTFALANPSGFTLGMSLKVRELAR